MERDKIVEAINNQLEDIREQFEIIKGYEGKIPEIELDLVMSNIRKVYEALLQLEKFNQPVIHFTVNEKQPEAVREPETLEESQEKPPEVSKEPEAVEEPQEKPPEMAKEPEAVEEPQEKPPEMAKEPEAVEEPQEQPPEMSKQPEDRPEPVTAGKETEPAPPADPTPVAEKEEKTMAGSDTDGKNDTQKRSKTTLDLFGEAAGTLADRLKGNDEKRVADKLQVEQIVDIKSIIGINEKFLFINELFEGSLKNYEDAITRLNQCSSIGQATQLLEEFSATYKWEPDNPATQSFVELVHRKF
jgi:hypothetical protein